MPKTAYLIRPCTVRARPLAESYYKLMTYTRWYYGTDPFTALELCAVNDENDARDEAFEDNSLMHHYANLYNHYVDQYNALADVCTQLLETCTPVDIKAFVAWSALKRQHLAMLLTELRRILDKPGPY